MSKVTVTGAGVDVRVGMGVGGLRVDVTIGVGRIFVGALTAAVFTELITAMAAMQSPAIRNTPRIHPQAETFLGGGRN